MNIPMHTSNVIKSSNFLICISFNFRTIHFLIIHSNIYEKIDSNLLINNQIQSHDIMKARSNNQLSILRLNVDPKQNIVFFTMI